MALLRRIPITNEETPMASNIGEVSVMLEALTAIRDLGEHELRNTVDARQAVRKMLHAAHRVLAKIEVARQMSGPENATEEAKPKPRKYALELPPGTLKTPEDRKMLRQQLDTWLATDGQVGVLPPGSRLVPLPSDAEIELATAIVEAKVNDALRYEDYLVGTTADAPAVVEKPRGREFI